MNRQQTSSAGSPLIGMLSDVKKLGLLYVNQVRLKGAEKLTVLISSIVLISVLVVIGFFFLVFGSIGFKYLLAPIISPTWAYLSIAAFFFILFVLLLLLRKPLFVNPIARLVSQILLDDPKEASDTNYGTASTDSSATSPSESSATNEHSNLNIEIDYDILAKRVVLMLEKDNAEKADND